MFEQLVQINKKPKPFEFYTADLLWDDDHTSSQMLTYHLNGDVDISSRKTDFIDASVEWIANKHHLGAGTRICDFGCGPGLYATRFAERGAVVTGVDFSRRSIQHARKTADVLNLEIDYQVMNYLDFQSPKQFDLITMVMCDFCALSPEQRQRLLGVFNRHLADGGSLLFDVYSETAFSERQETCGYEFRQLDGFWSADEYYGFYNTFKYDDEKVILDRYTIIESSRTFEVFNWLQYFSPDSLAADLQKGGFAIAEQYADLAGNPYDPESSEFAVVARR